MNYFVGSVLMWILAALLPACVLAAAAYYLTSRPLRREERARFLLELIESALAQGQPVERYIASLAETRDKSLGTNFHLLGAYLQQGRSLASALEQVPGLGPPQLAAMLAVGESLGDYGRVLPACRELLRDSLSESRALINYQVGFAFVLNPVLAAGLWVVGLKIVPIFKSLLATLGAGDMRSLEFIMRLTPWLCVLQMALVLALYSFSVLILGGPRFLSWLEVSLLPLADHVWLRVPWRRKRLQCDFSAMLSVLLDANLPEEQAVTLAARSTANAGFIGLGRQAVERLRAGLKLSEALQCFDETGEFCWRLKNAGHGGGRFFQALNGWHEWLHARACQQEQTAAQTISTSLLLLNGASVALVAALAIGGIAHITGAYMGLLEMSAAIDIPPALDRVRVIRRSMRCFSFGLLAAVPCFGLGTAWLAFKLYRDIAAETGEQIKLYPLFLTSISGLVLGAVCCGVGWPDAALGDAIVMLALQFLFLRRQYLKNEPAEWNPGRHLMYSGLGLANAGLILSAIFVMVSVYMVNHS